MPSPFGDHRALESDQRDPAVERLPRRQVGLVNERSTSGDNEKTSTTRTEKSPAGQSRTDKRSSKTADGKSRSKDNAQKKPAGTRAEQRKPLPKKTSESAPAPVESLAKAAVLPTPIRHAPPIQPVSQPAGFGSMSQSNPDSGLSLTDYRDAIWRRKIVFAGVLAAVLALAILFFQTRTPTFVATTRVVLQATAAEQTIDRAFVNPAYAGRALSNEIKIANSDTVTDQGGSLLESAVEREVTADLDADVLNFTVRSIDAGDAATAANRWAAVYLAAKQKNSVDSIAEAASVLRNQLARIRDDRQQLLADQGLDVLIADLATETDPEEIASLQRQVDQLQLAIEPELAALDAERNAVATAISELNISGQLAGVGTARILETATVPEVPVGVGLNQLLVLSLIAGSLLGLAAVIVLERSDQRILTQRDAKRASGLPLLGAVARPVGMDKSVPPEQAARLHPGSGMAEAYHGLGQSVRFAALGGEMDVLLVTSSGPSEGKTTTSVNLAWVLSSSGLDVILVDLDLRKPRVHSIYDEELTPGFADFALGKVTLDEAARTPDSRRPNLRVLPAGTAPADVASFLHTDSVKEALALMSETADLVIIDSPPALPVSDASILASNVDGVLVIARAGQTSGEDLSQCVANLQLAGGRVLGSVLTGISANRGAYGTVPYGTPEPRSRFNRDRSLEEEAS